MNINYDALMVLFILSMAIGTITMTVSKSKFFEVIQKDYTFLKCPYCVGHWLAAILYVMYLPVVMDEVFLIDHVVSYFVLVTLVAMWQLIIGALFVTLEELE